MQSVLYDDSRKDREPQAAKLLWGECRQTLLRHSAAITPQDRRLLQQVVGTGGTAEGYVYGGFTANVGIRAALHAFGKNAANFHSILDFGCGSGRIIRWFKDLVPNARLCGTDISQIAVNWCRQNIDYVEFSRNEPSPPLQYSNAHFDFVIGVSVFTHLDESLQLAWLAELDRITAPGALLFVTVHGEEKARKDLGGRALEEFLHEGHYYHRADERPSVDGLPDFYQVAFHSRAYIERVWSRHFNVLGYIEHGPMYAQELVVMRKRDKQETGTGRANSARAIRLPIAVLEFPSPAIKINLDQFEMRGWAFWPNEAKVDLLLWIDDEIVGQCSAEYSRPDVAKAFYTNRTAGKSGFRKTVSVRKTGGGPHMAWISRADQTFPICASFFRRDGQPIRMAKRLVRKFA